MQKDTQLQKDKAPRRISMTEIIPKDGNWKKYSLFHDSFLEELSYEKQNIFPNFFFTWI